MKPNCFRSIKKSNESGQIMFVTALALGIFLIGAMAFAIDLSNMWFNRQSAQTAADAACTAAAMDMLVGATNGTMPANAHFTAASANTYDCNSASPLPSPCSYAALNGYSSTISQTNANSGKIGDNVFIDFNTLANASNWGVGSLNLPPVAVAGAPLVRVRITNNISTWFAGMLKGMTKQSTGATSICAVLQATSPIPILVLNPTIANAFHVQGTPNVNIVGGPSKSVQVNSSSTSAATFGGAGANVNLCAGGGTYCGSAMGVWGSLSSLPGSGQFYSTAATCSANRPAGAPACSATQTAPQFNDPSAPIADPLAAQVAPSLPTNPGTITPVASGTNGCPAPVGKTCSEYTPGSYTSGILVKDTIAIFDPGIYYVTGRCKPGATGSFCSDSNSCIRPSNATGDGSGGTIFYFADTNGFAVNVGANAGCDSGNGTATAFNTTSGTGSLANGVKCTASSVIPSNLPATLTGSVLLAPCRPATSVSSLCASANSNANCTTNFGDPELLADPIGEQRGILFFEDRAVNAGNNPSWDGGGASLLAGTIYFHQCVTSGSDTGQGCSSSAYNDQMQLGGNSGNTTYVLGDIIVDQLQLQGTSGITMDLNPSASFTTLKAALVQ